jgi:hypothetical protein
LVLLGIPVYYGVWGKKVAAAPAQKEEPVTSELP